MRDATYTTGKSDYEGMVRIYRNGKALGWADADDAEATIEEHRAEDRAEYLAELQEKIGARLEACEDPETLERIMALLG